jgi:hypothetical protein
LATKTRKSGYKEEKTLLQECIIGLVEGGQRAIAVIYDGKEGMLFA